MDSNPAVAGRRRRIPSKVPKWWAFLIVMFRLFIFAGFCLVPSVGGLGKESLHMFSALLIPFAVFFAMTRLVNRNRYSRSKLFEQVALESLPYFIMVCLVVWVCISLVLVQITSLLTTIYAVSYFPQDLKSDLFKEVLNGTSKQRQNANFTETELSNKTGVENDDEYFQLINATMTWTFNYMNKKHLKNSFHRILTNLSVDAFQEISQDLPEKFQDEFVAREFATNLFRFIDGGFLGNKSEHAKKNLTDTKKNVTNTKTDQWEEKFDKESLKRLKEYERRSQGMLLGVDHFLYHSIIFLFYSIFQMFIHAYIYLLCRRCDSIEFVSVKDVCVFSICAVLGLTMLGPYPTHAPLQSLQGLLRMLLQGFWLGCIVADNKMMDEIKSSFASVLSLSAVMSILDAISRFWYLRLCGFALGFWHVSKYYLSLRRREREPGMTLHED